MYRIRETYIRKKIQILIWILNMIHEKEIIQKSL